MKNSEFKKLAKENGYNIYSVKVVRENGNKGIEISWSKQLNKTTQTTENIRFFWNQDLEEIYNTYFRLN